MALYGADATGQTVLQNFDLVAANSGGSIVLGGLVEDLPLAKLFDFFNDQALRQTVFSPTHSFGDKALRDLTGMGPKYSAENKLVALRNVFPLKGAMPLDQAAPGVHLLITAFDYDRNRATFFRSSPASGEAWGSGATADVTLAEAIHASTNAPVNYFDAPAAFPDRPGRYWDGAITGCNNPVLAAVTEAITLNRNPADLAVLSIGTGSVALPWPRPGESGPYVQQLVDPGLITDLHKLATSILDDPPDIATFLAHVMTGGAGRIVRMSPLISPVVVNTGDNAGTWVAPGAMTTAQFRYLAGIDIDAIEQPQVNAISSYADLWIDGVAPNQPIRMNGDTLVSELGQTRFPDALAAWNAIR